MLKKMKTNVMWTIVLFIIAHGISWYLDGLDVTKNAFLEYWWIWLIMPFALRLYAWFRGLKRKAFNYGAGIKEDKSKNE